MRLIDADALIDDIKNNLWDWDTVDGIKAQTVLRQTITDIGNAPTIDAVPLEQYQSMEATCVKLQKAIEDTPQVVRCKDCFLYGECKAAEWYGENGNGYCSVGDRRKGND